MSETNQQKNDGFQNPEGLQAVFVKIYILLLCLAFAFLLMHFMFSFVDIFKYILRNIRQKDKLSDNGKVFNKDSNEHKLLHYTKYKREGEPYNIYLRQIFIDFMYVFISVFIIALSFQIGITTAFIIMNKFKGIDSTIKFALPIKLIASITIIAIFTYILTRIYDIKFVKGVKVSLTKNQNIINEINNYIYNNMTTNQDFLEALLDNDKYVQYEILNKQTTYYGLIKILFTISLYEHLSSIKNTSEEYQDIRKIFTIDQIKLRSIKPVDYLYYNENIYIKNYYNSLKKYIKPDVITRNNEIDENKEYILNVQLNNKLSTLNNKILALNKISKSNSDLLVYLIIILILGFLMVMSFSIIYYKPVFEFIKNLKKLFNNKDPSTDTNTNTNTNTNNKDNSNSTDNKGNNE